VGARHARPVRRGNIVTDRPRNCADIEGNDPVSGYPFMRATLDGLSRPIAEEDLKRNDPWL